jgi:hypothetical protein
MRTRQVLRAWPDGEKTVAYRKTKTGFSLTIREKETGYFLFSAKEIPSFEGAKFLAHMVRTHGPWSVV